MDWKLLVVLAAALLAGHAQANCNAAEGFSGRVADCTSCHATPPLMDDDANLVVEGLPAAWDVATTYRVSIRVDDGPMAREGLPQGGFDMEVLGGRLDSVDGLTKPYYDRGMSYTVDGAMVRSWELAWTAPDLSRPPAPLDIWVAGMAADGGHTQTIGGDQSEKYDSVDTFHTVIPPSQAAIDAWRALPLAAPTWTLVEGEIRGQHADGNATHLAWRTGDDWERRATGDNWRIVPPATGDLWVRSEGSDRVSPEVQVLRRGEIPQPAPVEDAPFPFLAVLLGLLIARRMT